LKRVTNRNIGLIGFMGTGKTAIGSALAIDTHRQFFDTDTLIEQRAGKTITEIFEEEGEIVFREMESQVVIEVCGLDSSVISFGGGVVLSPSNIETIRKTTYVVLLKASVETISSRTSLHFTRPLLDSKANLHNQIKNLLASREALYDKAKDVELETDLMSVDDAVQEIKRRIYL